MQTDFLCISVLRVASGPRVKLAVKVLLNPPPPPTAVYSTNRSKAVVPVFLLMSGKGFGLWLWHSLDFSRTFFTICWFVVYSTKRFVLCLTLCYFATVFFNTFSIAITLLGEDTANLSAFRTFVGCLLVWFRLFPLPLCIWEGLRFVIVALLRLFSYLFLHGVWRKLAQRFQRSRRSNVFTDGRTTDGNWSQ